MDGSSDTVVINTNVYKISGSCKVNGTEVSDDTWVYLHKKGDATELSNYTFDEGKYEFYVEPGEYEIKVSLDSRNRYRSRRNDYQCICREKFGVSRVKR